MDPSTDSLSSRNGKHNYVIKIQISTDNMLAFEINLKILKPTYISRCPQRPCFPCLAQVCQASILLLSSQ